MPRKKLCAEQPTQQQSTLGTSKKFSPKICEYLSTKRKEGKLLDFTIQVDKTAFRVHRIVLACSSGYFDALLKSGDKEAQEGKVTVVNIALDSMPIVLDYCYGEEITLTPENVEQVLHTSSRFKMNELLNFCIDFIKNNLNNTNCLRTLRVAHNYNLPKLFKDSLKYCLEQFEILNKTNEFLRLDVGWLIKLIRDDNLIVSNKDVVLEAVLNWVAFDKTRRVLLSSILEDVRLPMMSAAKLIELEEQLLIDSNDHRALMLIRRAKNFKLLEDGHIKKSEMKGPHFSPRACSRLPPLRKI